jgi:integrase
MPVVAGPAASAGAGANLLEKLLAVVRPEFRVDVLVPSPEDPVLGVPCCAVSRCDYPVADHGICNGHRLRWRGRGMPPLPEFLADPGAPLRGRAALSHCAVRGCLYGAAGQGLCYRHRTRWERAGKPDPSAWAADVPAIDAAGHRQCRLLFCGLWTESPRAVFCRSHTLRWQRAGRPEIEEFIAECARLGKAHIDLRSLPAQIKLELQYVLQTRGDTKIPISPEVISIAVGWVARAGVNSLLDPPGQPANSLQPVGGPGRGGGKYGRARAFLNFAREAVETLRDGTGWDVEYPKDIWRLAKLPGLVLTAGQTREHARLRFDRITQPWLRELGKRWIRLRLISGLNVETVVGNLQALTRFSQFLATATAIGALADIDRALLERFLAWLAAQPGGPVTKSRHIGGVQLFFDAIRRHRWDNQLPTTAVFFTEDYPKRPPRMTRHLAEHVMNQIEQPANLDRWPSPEGRLVTIILIHCGLRISDACTLPFDCLLHDGQQAPYLRYRNNKMHREAAVPIDEQLEREIRIQQEHVLRRWPEGSPHLFPRPTSNPGGNRPLAASTYRTTLRQWLRRCDIRDAHGQPVQLTPHQWRHTFACRLINRDVPQEIVRVLLNHDSHEMTAHYARITDQTVRRRWEQATKINIRGERVSIAPEGPLAQAQWAKTRYGMATQTLPNGYCGLPLQKSCPHANACLTCPVFLTGPEFLPELREQRRRTLTLIDVSNNKGQSRMVEMNQQILTNLERMINEAEQGEREDTTNAG